MKILATLDRTEFSEAILLVLAKMAALPDAEVILLSVGHASKGRESRRPIRRPITTSDAMGSAIPFVVTPPEPVFVEDRGQAITRRVQELAAYLSEKAHTLPAGTNVRLEPHVGEHPAEVIIERAGAEDVDVIVMATHSRSNLTQALFGSVAEDVVRSGVAPVLLVHPTA